MVVWAATEDKWETALEDKEEEANSNTVVAAATTLEAAEVEENLTDSNSRIISRWVEEVATERIPAEEEEDLAAADLSVL